MTLYLSGSFLTSSGLGIGIFKLLFFNLLYKEFILLSLLRKFLNSLILFLIILLSVLLFFFFKLILNLILLSSLLINSNL